MKSLLDYEVITNELFYKGWHILEYIGNNKLTDLDIEVISASIMDALVYKREIDPNTQSLDLANLRIVDNLDYYRYTKHPNIKNIPLCIKEKLGKRVALIAAGQPISLFLAKAPSKFSRYCVYDPNYAFSSIFEETTFYQCLYDSPTRPGVRLTEVRPFIEVDIDGELYLVDTITNRMFKSSWFKPNFNFEAISTLRKSEFNKEQRTKYKEMTSQKRISLAEMIPFYELSLQHSAPYQAEMIFELEKSKINFPEEWKKAEILKNEMAEFFKKQKQ